MMVLDISAGVVWDYAKFIKERSGEGSCGVPKWGIDRKRV